MSNAGPYDQGLNESFQNAFKDYFTGNVDEDTAKANFETAIKEKYPAQLVMAACDNIENALACAGAGADFVGTTMRGYTPETTGINDVDFGFIAQLARECPAKVIAEGHIHTPEQAVQALSSMRTAGCCAAPSAASALTATKRRSWIPCRQPSTNF